LSQFTTQVLSIVRHPRPVTFNSRGVPTGPDAGVKRERLGDVDGALRDRLAVDPRDDFVHAAVIFRDREASAQAPGRVDGELPERRSRLRVLLTAEVIVTFHDPATGHRPPDKIDGLASRQSRGRRVHRGADDRRLVVGEIKSGDALTGFRGGCGRAR
jgi:hypothetical protein